MKFNEEHFDIIKSIPVEKRFAVAPEPYRTAYIKLLIEINEVRNRCVSESDASNYLIESEYFIIHAELFMLHGDIPRGQHAINFSISALASANKKLEKYVADISGKAGLSEQLKRYAAGEITTLRTSA
jgi:hypothetical protein